MSAVAWPQIAAKERALTSFIFAQSVNGLPIPAFQFGTQGPKVLILGGVHGDEPEGAVLAWGLVDLLQQKPLLQLQIVVIPQFNLDGLLAHQRQNANGVDLNRNMPTKDWSPEIKGPRYQPGPSPNSEPETKALVRWLEKEKPSWILSLHSWHPVLNVNGNCLAQAEAISQINKYKIDTDIGYPTPGCLGTFAGLERSFPTLTFEIERGQSPSANLAIHRPAIWSALDLTAKKGTS